MKKQIIHISVFQSSKALSVLSALIVAIFAFPIGLLLILGGHSREGLALLVYPFLILLFVFIGHAIFFALYNLVVHFFGGIEVSFTEIEEKHLKEFKDD